MMSSKNMLLRSKAVRLTVARLDIMWLARGADPLLVTADHVVNLIAGALPVVFTIAAVVVGAGSPPRCGAASTQAPHMRNLASRATVRGASKKRKCNG
jgi:hypothetical protein